VRSFEALPWEPAIGGEPVLFGFEQKCDRLDNMMTRAVRHAAAVCANDANGALTRNSALAGKPTIEIRWRCLDLTNPKQINTMSDFRLAWPFCVNLTFCVT
jgi:hypothetical protein